jgi:polysaccharide pyruvyl transferase WcaK-like protein
MSRDLGIDTKARTPERIGLLHHLGGGNLGDDASLNAVLDNIRTRWPHAEIFGFTMNPDYTTAKHGIPCYPIRALAWSFGNSEATDSSISLKDKVKSALRRYRLLIKLLTALHAVLIGIPGKCFREIAFLIKSFRCLRSFDLLIITGGGQLIESSGGPWSFLGGPWKFPYTIFKWVVLGRLARVKVIVLNVGAGPLVSLLGKAFVRGALSLSDYVSFRDKQSEMLIRSIGFDGRSHVFPDSAYSRDVSALRAGREGRQGRFVVGLAPMAYGDPRLSTKHDQAPYDSYIQQLGAFGSWLIMNRYDVTLFCTDIGVDPPAVVDVENIVKASVGAGTGSLCRVHQWSTEELLSNMSSMDCVVTSRFHAVVFAHMLTLPVLAICNHKKVKTLMDELGMSEYCLDVQRCNSEALTEAFLSLAKNHEAIKSRMAEKLVAYRRQLSDQFDELFPYEIPVSVPSTNDRCTTCSG